MHVILMAADRSYFSLMTLIGLKVGEDPFYQTEYLINRFSYYGLLDIIRRNYAKNVSTGELAPLLVV